MHVRDKRYVQSFGEETEENRTLGRPTCRWQNNIKTDPQEVGWETWTGLIWLRIGTSAFVNAVMNLRVPYNARNFLSSSEPVSF